MPDFFESLECRTLLSTVPNDPQFASQWYLRNTGQTVNNQVGTPNADIDATRAWDLSTGDRNVVVAVIDTGVDIANPDLAANIWTNPGVNDQFHGADVHGWNFADNNADVSDNPLNPHGTLVAGVIGAVGNNARQIAGVNWNVSILPVKVGSTAGLDVSNIVAGIDYVVSLKQLGIDVVAINASFESFAPPSAAEINAIARARDNGILYVNAAGNESTDISALSLLPGWSNLTNVLTVAATDNRDNLASFSNFGRSSVELAAPGQDILTTGPFNTTLTVSGTSFSAPMVSGAVALLAAFSPQATTAQIRQAILSSVDPDPSLTNTTITGGRLNVYNAMQSLIGNPNPFGSLDVANAGTIAGWAFDFNSGATPISVQIKIDGQVVATVAADQSRPDLESFLGSTDHGFVYHPSNLATGAHTVEIDALDFPSNNPVDIAVGTLTVTPPGGNVDILDPAQIVGWAYAPSSPATSIFVRVDVDGHQGTEFLANDPRPDLTSFVGSPNHGFHMNFSNLASGYHRIDVWAFDPDTGAGTLFASRTLNTNTPPGGFVDVANPTTVAGWAFDANSGAAAIQVQLLLDGTPRIPVTANLARPDLVSFLGSANHGYLIDLPILPVGNHTVQVLAIDPVDKATVALNAPTTITVSRPNETSPIGNIDILQANRIVGWAFDPALNGAPSTVRIDINGSPAATVTANGSRPDLVPLGSTSHGFDVALSPPSTPFLADVYALASAGPVLVASRWFAAGQAPGGNVDVISTDTIAGWAVEPADPSRVIQVRIDVDGSFGTLITANANRPDLTSFLGSANHGFVVAPPPLSRGQHTLAIRAIDPATFLTTTLATATLTYP